MLSIQYCSVCISSFIACTCLALFAAIVGSHACFHALCCHVIDCVCLHSSHAQYETVHAPRDLTIEVTPEVPQVENEELQQIEVEQESVKMPKRQRLKRAAAGAWRGIRSLVSYSSSIYAIHILLSNLY
jgi:hypothetical protein